MIELIPWMSRGTKIQMMTGALILAVLLTLSLNYTMHMVLVVIFWLLTFLFAYEGFRKGGWTQYKQKIKEVM